jgi:predicted RNA-binding Zn ribbon-like protein
MTPEGFLFELSGGALCLDFVNTCKRPHGSDPKELLGCYADLVAWGAQAGAVTPEEARLLEKTATERPRDADTAIKKARVVRETLFFVFSVRAAGNGLPAKALEALGPEIVSALAHLRLSRGDGTKAVWTWPDEPALDRVLWPILRSAADLLTSDDLERLRECASDTCAWLFLDRSKNGSRRWCDMTVCGNRDKVRRHRLRQRGKKAGTPPSRRVRRERA